MKLRPIRLWRDSDPVLVEIMRDIFVRTINDLSTKPLVPPTPAEQQVWWEMLDHSNVKVFLWRPIERPWEIVAFSMITDRGDHATPMFAIDPVFQGRGYAREIIDHYIRTAGKPLRGEQLKSNEAIRKLNAEAGWRLLATEGGIEYLRHPGVSALPPRYPDYSAILEGLDG